MTWKYTFSRSVESGRDSFGEPLLSVLNASTGNTNNASAGSP